VLAATQVTSGPFPVNVYGPLDPGGASSVSATTSFHVRFDRLLDPITATRQSICVQPLLTNVVGPSDCLQGVFSVPSYDPVKREVAYHLTSGNLPPTPRYKLTLYSAGQLGNGGVFSYDGVELAQTYTVEFDVLPPGAVLAPLDTGPVGDHYCTARPGCRPAPGAPCPRSVSVILNGCALGGCHGSSPSPDAGSPDMPSEDLSLGDLGGLLHTALDQPAHETQTGEMSGIVPSDPLRFGQDMAVLSTTAGPGYSYLVYKLLANRLIPLQVPWPDGSLTVDPTQVAILRDDFVVGMPMPPDTAPGALLLPGEIEWLSEWILLGAPLPAQPCP
jgi:hypothetical protein